MSHRGSYKVWEINIYESAHTWNLMILRWLVALGMTFIFMVHFSYYAIPLLIYDVMYNITTTPKCTQL